MGQIRRSEATKQAEPDSYRIVDSLEEKPYDDLTRLAAETCQTPIRFKLRIGKSATEAPGGFARCEHPLLKPGETPVVRGASIDARFRTNQLGVKDPRIRFCADAPLISPSGHTLGAICAIDTQPSDIDPEQLEELGFPAQQVITRLEERQHALASEVR